MGREQEDWLVILKDDNDIGVLQVRYAKYLYSRIGTGLLRNWIANPNYDSLVDYLQYPIKTGENPFVLASMFL